LYFTLRNPFLSGKLKFGKGSNNSYVSVLAPDFYMQDFTALIHLFTNSDAILNHDALWVIQGKNPNSKAFNVVL
jgi:hypothetical protein